MSTNAAARAELMEQAGRYYTSCDLSLLQEVYDKVHDELVARDSPALRPDTESETRTRVARAIMDLAEAGIRNPITLKQLTLRSIAG